VPPSGPKLTDGRVSETPAPPSVAPAATVAEKPEEAAKAAVDAPKEVIDAAKESSTDAKAVIDAPKESSTDAKAVIGAPKESSTDAKAVIDAPKESSTDAKAVIDAPKESSTDAKEADAPASKAADSTAERKSEPPNAADSASERKSEPPKAADSAPERRDSTAPKSGKGKKNKRDSKAPPASKPDGNESKDVPIADVSDHRLDDHSEEFFSKPSLPHLHDDGDHEDDFDDHLPAAVRARALASEVAEQRRAEVRKYVQIGLAVCAVLVAFALYKFATKPQVDSLPTPTVEAAKPTETAKPAETAKPVETAKPAETQATATPSASASASAAPSASASAAPAEGAPPSEDDKKAAKAARTKAERLIDSGKYADAIAAGEEATRLDPTHAQGWLLLGAAHDAKGDRPGAKAAYRECVKLATTGPKGECAAFAR
jgi:hypothetical protein